MASVAFGAIDRLSEETLALTKSFKALVVSETPNDRFQRTIMDRPLNLLPDQDTVIPVHYSSLNHKDALSAYRKGSHASISLYEGY